MRKITAWFQGNGGLIQFGWKPRNLAQITCEERLHMIRMIRIVSDLAAWTAHL